MRRTTAFAIAAALLPGTLALGACSGSSGGAPKAAGTTAPAPAASSSASTSPATTAPTPTASAQSDASLLTGAELNQYLVPASYFPSGFASVAAETQNSGTLFEPQSINEPGVPDCTLFDTNGLLTITGYSPVSFTQGDYQSKSTFGEYAQEIDEFQGDASQTLMTSLAAAAAVCPTYPDSQTNTSAHVKQSASTIGGDPALVFTTTDSQWASGLTIEAVRVGTAVVSVMVSDGNSDNGTPEATKLAGTIVANLAAKS